MVFYYYGGSGGTRTHDRVLKRHLLYQLSYRPIYSVLNKKLVFTYTTILRNFTIFGIKNQP